MKRIAIFSRGTWICCGNGVKDGDWNLTSKSAVIEFGKSGTRVKGHYKLGNDNLNKKTEEKDLGVIITDNLSPERHVNKK